MNIRLDLRPADLAEKLHRFWTLSGEKIRAIEATYDPADGSPVFTVKGRYTTRGWTEWTQGFQYGSAILQFDATGEAEFLEIGRRNTLAKMAPHVSHVGVHDHGFNNVSTYGNLLRLMNEGRIAEEPWERNFYELAMKLSGAIQARRWTEIPAAEGDSPIFVAFRSAKAAPLSRSERRQSPSGYIYSFNGPHSLFVDTIRSLRVLAIAHKLGHALMEENDRRISLLDRIQAHALATAKWSIYYGRGRDAYDIRGRTAHESIFNINDGAYRCPNSQQGYSPFSTWTRGLAWAMCGFAELLEFFKAIGQCENEGVYREAARATCDFYIEQATAADGIPYWDTGAPNLHRLGDWQSRPAEPENPHEPVDSSAAAIAAQGLMRLGHYLGESRYMQAGVTVLRTLLDEPYLSTRSDHQGLLLHSVYHRPNGWDHVPPDRKVPCGESSMWGDYHLREAALYVGRLAAGLPYLTFWGGPP
jgi:unsaturated chondroitin disaccharide hydrolase